MVGSKNALNALNFGTNWAKSILMFKDLLTIRRMVNESILEAYRKSDFYLKLDGDYVSVQMHGYEDKINLEIFRLKPYPRIKYGLVLLETIADHPIKKESIDYWINEIDNGKGVKAELHKFINGDIFSLKEGIIELSETGTRMLKYLEEKIYGAELSDIPKEKWNEMCSLNVGSRNITVPSPELIYNEIRLFKKFEKSEFYPFQSGVDKSGKSLRPLPEGCKVEEVEDTYLLFIYGKEMVTADSGKFYILDVGKKCFDILHNPRKGGDAELLSYLKENGLIDSDYTTTKKGWDISGLLRIYLPGRKHASKSRKH